MGAGSNFVIEMQRERAATKSSRTIAILSPDYLESQFATSEWAAAFARDPEGTKRMLIPVRVRPCNPGGLLKSIVYLDVVGLDEAAARDKLLSGISAKRGKPTNPPSFPGNATRVPAKAPANATDVPPFRIRFFGVSECGSMGCWVLCAKNVATNNCQVAVTFYCFVAYS